MLRTDVSYYANERQKYIDFDTLQADPARRKRISYYHPDIQNEVRKTYLIKGAHQPRKFTFPWTQYNSVRRRFCVKWFDKYDWLEYSESKNAAYCLPCYSFKNIANYGGEAFVGIGFDDWNNSIRISKHGNCSNGEHGDCVYKGRDLLNLKQSIMVALTKQTVQKNIDYKVHLNTSLIATKYLLRGGSPFRGHDESQSSSYKGHFLETINLLKECNQDLCHVLNCAPGNNNMTSPLIQKSLTVTCAYVITKLIVDDIGDDVFDVLIDESGDCSGKEQMDVVVCYVDKEGLVMERFLGIMHVKETSATSLKEALQNLLGIHKLSISSIRRQGYDGASNMSGRFGGLKTLIQNETPAAYYVHCFTHQLQLTLVACSKCQVGVSAFFGKVNSLVNLIRSSNKRMEQLRGKQKMHYVNILEERLIQTGRGLNQESSIVRACDTRWESHFNTLNSLMHLYGPVLGVLEEVGSDSSFEDMVLGITQDLNTSLQKCDQDLLNALQLLTTAKRRLQELRDDGWEELLSKVMEVCYKHEFEVSYMDAPYVQGKKSR